MKAITTSLITYTITTVIVLSCVLFAYMALSPIDILQNWKLTVDTSKEYKEGSVLTVNTQFDKVRSITGISKRYIICDTPNNANVRFPLNEADADRGETVSNREQIYFTIPTTLPSLPANCEVEIVIEYTVYSFRKHLEIQRSNPFKVIEDKKAKAEEPESGNIYTESSEADYPQNSRVMPREIPREIPKPAERQVQPPKDTTKPTTDEDSPIRPPCDRLYLNLFITEICLRSDIVSGLQYVIR